MELLAIGSESYIYLDQDKVIKDRIRRFYMEEKLDEDIRKTRTTIEFNILKKLSSYLNVPKVYDKNKYSFSMQYIEGKTPSLDSEMASLIGKTLRSLHDLGVIHYDLSIYNILDDGNKYYIIDFGLSFYSNKIEDRAMDLLVSISQAIDYEQEIIKAYNADERIIKRMEQIRARARYATG